MEIARAHGLPLSFGNNHVHSLQSMSDSSQHRHGLADVISAKRLEDSLSVCKADLLMAWMNTQFQENYIMHGNI